MCQLKHLFENNAKWAAGIKRQDPEFFARLAGQQSPRYLWIGCSDSRVPANEIVGLLPGELFVHRNVGNIVLHTDINCLSVLQYAVDILRVEHVIVCGHYRCGGVRSALEDQDHGLIDNWIYDIKDIHRRHSAELDALNDDARLARMCELNVVEQTNRVYHTTIAQRALQRGQPLSVHGWIYDVADGILRDLKVALKD